MFLLRAVRVFAKTRTMKDERVDVEPTAAELEKTMAGVKEPLEVVAKTSRKNSEKRENDTANEIVNI